MADKADGSTRGFTPEHGQNVPQAVIAAIKRLDPGASVTTACGIYAITFRVGGVDGRVDVRPAYEIFAGSPDVMEAIRLDLAVEDIEVVLAPAIG